MACLQLQNSLSKQATEPVITKFTTPLLVLPVQTAAHMRCMAAHKASSSAETKQSHVDWLNDTHVGVRAFILLSIKDSWIPSCSLYTTRRVAVPPCLSLAELCSRLN
jgi:hypothetical protein